MNLELRWFFKDEKYVEIIKSCKEKKYEESIQNDLYLVLQKPHCQFLGIKVSRDTFDVKYRNSVKEISIGNGSVTGKAEVWAKCSLPLLNPEEYSFDSIDMQKVGINKTRYKQKYEVKLPECNFNPTNKRIDDGIAMEVTKIEVNNETWWTLAFDIFGENKDVILRDCLIKKIKDLPELNLEVPNSLSYPEWINKFCTK